MRSWNCGLTMGFLVAACLVGVGLSTTAEAALDFVSGVQGDVHRDAVDQSQVAVNLANGFPLWYEDANGLQLELCLDRQVELPGGVVVTPCEVAAPLVGAPISFPGNFGAEAMYWSAVTFGTFTSSNGLQYQALLVAAQEAGFTNEGSASDGNQAVFSRIRLRIDVPVAGTYRVTHPFGSIDYVVTTPGTRAINQTQDLGILDVQDFLVSMRNRENFVVPNPFNPADGDVEGGVVNSDGATVGPFLVPAAAFNPATLAGGPVVGVNGATYIGLPFAPNPANPGIPLEVFQPVSGGENDVNYLEIELRNPPLNFTLDAGAIDGTADNTVRLSNFQLIGKIFDDRDNVAPNAEPVTVGTAVGRSISINVFPNGTDHLDPVGSNNVHGINPQAIAVADPVSGGPVLNNNGMPILTAEVPTAMGGRVRRVIPVQSGQGVFFYTPPPAPFTGTDTFNYVVQDTGGLISEPATVTVVVEDLQVERSDFRLRTGKYRISGTSSNNQDNAISLFAEPRTVLTRQVPPLDTDSGGAVQLRVAENAIEFLVKADLESPATRITLNVGALGENGPAIFTLYEGLFGLPFVSPLSGTLRSFNLQPRPERGISTFSDAIDAILRGDAYVDVTTVAMPGGDIRGQMVRPGIGSAPVTDGRWRFGGPALLWPGPLPGISAESINGVRTLGGRVRSR